MFSFWLLGRLLTDVLGTVELKLPELQCTKQIQDISISWIINQIVTSYLIQLLLKVEHSLDSNTDLVLRLMYKLVNIWKLPLFCYYYSAFSKFYNDRTTHFFINELEEEKGNICAVYLRVVNIQIKHKALINFLLLIM